ncbi:MAG: MMPL family transporter, partial [Chitinivibrionales bacterium]|nr:MMPL family transporter [Chitinivibrionales bacterium]
MRLPRPRRLDVPRLSRKLQPVDGLFPCCGRRTTHTLLFSPTSVCILPIGRPAGRERISYRRWTCAMNIFAAFRYPKSVVIAIALITGFFAWHLPSLVINNDVIIFLPENNPHRKAFRALNEEFGRNDGIIIAAIAKQGTITDGANIDALMRMTRELERIDSVDGVLSLTTSDYVEGVAGGIETFPIVEQVPRDSAGRAEIQRRLRTWDIYKNTLYTDDLQASMLLITPYDHTSIRRDEAIYFTVLDIIDSYRATFDFHVAGFPSIFVLVGRNMTHDLAWLIPFVVVVVILTLWYSFRTVGGVLLPLLTVVISTIWSLGLMSLLGIEMTLIATVVPVLLVAVGSAYGIHIMAHYYDEFHTAYASQSDPISPQLHEQVIRRALAGVGRPVLMAALTTIVGFGSLASSRIVPVRDFGTFTSIGVLAAFIIAVTLIPSLLHFFHARHRHRRTTPEHNPIVRVILARIERASHYPRTVTAIALTLAVLAVFGAGRIRIGSAVVDFFQRDSSVWQANEWLQNNTNGTVTLSVIVRDDGEGSLTHPDMLKALDDFGAQMKRRFAGVRKVGSLADLVKRMNEVMHIEERRADSTAEYYEIPYEPHKYGFEERDQLQQLIAQYLMLFSGDIDAFADDPISPTRLRVMLQMNTNDVDSLRRIQTAVREWFDEHIPERHPVEIAGTADAEIAVNRL